MTTRRVFLAAPIALAACDRLAATPEPASRDAVTPLKTLAPFPMGVAAMAGHLDDPAWVSLARRQFNQITPEWEMKMEYMLPDGPHDIRFDRPDRLADFARDNGMGLHGHALIWYSQGEETFRGLSGAEFDRAYDGYITRVAGHYRGRLRSWDVVNEPILDDGSAMRDCHWSARYGRDGYILRAFEKAREADPDAVLFLNEYNLEGVPRKGAEFLRLVERLLKAGCPIDGIGTQSHLWTTIPEGACSAFLREAAQFGLVLHVSELDCTLRTEDRLDLRARGQRIARQTALVTELTETFMALPARQRFGLTLWGLRDTDSVLRRDARDDGKDSPLAFGADGRPTAMGRALAQALTR